MLAPSPARRPLSLNDDDDDDDDLLDNPAFAVEPEPDEPSAIEYIAACTYPAVRCSQWQRACVSRASDVVLSHYGLGKRGAEPLAKSLALNVHVHTLDLSDNGLGPEGVATVLDVLQSARAAPKLRVLSLRQNQAGEEGAEALKALLASSGGHPLSSIDFGSNGIGSRGGEIVAEGLLAAHEGGCSQVATLSLEHNEIEDVERLAAAVRTSTVLTALSLEWNQIGPAGGKALAEALAAQPALARLNVGWNGLGDEGVRALAGAVELQPLGGPLRELRLPHNRMSEEASVPLSRALGGLDLLDVSGNALGAGGCAVLLLAQQELRVRAAPAHVGDDVDDGAALQARDGGRVRAARHDDCRPAAARRQGRGAAVRRAAARRRAGARRTHPRRLRAAQAEPQGERQGGRSQGRRRRRQGQVEAQRRARAAGQAEKLSAQGQVTKEIGR